MWLEAGFVEGSLLPCPVPWVAGTVVWHYEWFCLWTLWHSVIPGLCCTTFQPGDKNVRDETAACFLSLCETD